MRILLLFLEINFGVYEKRVEKRLSRECDFHFLSNKKNAMLSKSGRSRQLFIQKEKRRLMQVIALYSLLFYIQVKRSRSQTVINTCR